MTLTPGQRLGAYEVIDSLGAGGMGEVYRARDTRLHRDVALKVLPEIFARDTDRLARFKREAQVLASLNHPNVAAIHGLEECDDVQALVLELVEGPTLADRIAQGAMSLDEALPIARQIADALEAAHERGIIHRDLKPANIKVREDGTVKVLDFGLAKALERPSGSSIGPGDAGRYVLDSPTITSPVMTGIGMLLGTAAYMSPEQAKGRQADKRSDIWAFGCVLYEMLTGRRAFDGEDVTETLASVVKERVDIGQLPRQVRRLVAKCLERDPKNRLRDIGDAWVLLEPDQGQPKGHRAARWLTIAAATAAIAATTALVALAWIHFRETPPEPHALHYTIDVMDNASPARGTSFALSHDGRFIAMAARSNGRQQLWLRPLDSLEWRPLPGTDDGFNPFWSPDGRFIGFFDGVRLKKIAINGGPSVPLCNASGAAFGTWNDDDVIVFSSSAPSTIIQATGEFHRVSAAGGRPTPIPNVEGRSPQFLPDKRRFLYMNRPNGGGGVYLGSLDGQENQLIVPGAFLAGYALGEHNSGHLFFIRDATLMVQPFDVRQGATSGEAVPVAQTISQLFGLWAASVSGSGAIAYMSIGSAVNQLVLYDRKGKVLERVGAPGDVWTPSLSPGGQTVAYARFSGATSDVWLWDIARAVERRFTVDPSRNDSPVWSPDSQRIVFRSTRGGGQQDLWVKAANGSGQDVMLSTSRNPKYASQWTADDTILYSDNAGNTDIDLWSLSMAGARTPVKLLQTRFEETQGQLSPDRRWIAYTSNPTGQPEVYVAPLRQPEAAVRVSVAGGEQPRWGGDGRELFFISPDGKMMSAAVPVIPEQQQTFQHQPAQPLFDTRIATSAFTRAFQYDVARDGARFIVVTDTTSTRTAVPPLHLLVNWPALRR